MNNFKLIAAPEIIRIPIVENNELLIDLVDQDLIKFGIYQEIENNTDYTKIRVTVYNKLVEAQGYLPKELKFCLYEGYRSLALQKLQFEQRYNLVKSNHPDWDHEKNFIETTKMVSPLINLDGSKNIPPHSTGGAIDVYLINQNGQTLDMGIKVKDWMTDMDNKLSTTNSPFITEEAKNYRKIMSESLSRVGFVNYPSEYWHWSYGDRYWAYYTNNSHAIYGTI